jgi:hypothetical protein
MPPALRTVSAAAAKILEQLTAGLEPGQSKKIDNAPGAFMAVSVECLHRSAVGTHFSVTHYYEQNGDLVPDPDVELLKLGSGEWVPLAYQDARTYRRAAIVEGAKLKVARGELASLVAFVNTWVQNIKEQQGL